MKCNYLQSLNTSGQASSVVYGVDQMVMVLVQVRVHDKVVNKQDKRHEQDNYERLVADLNKIVEDSFRIDFQ